MPQYAVTASFTPLEIEAIDKKASQEGLKSRYQLMRKAVLEYVGLKYDGRRKIGYEKGNKRANAERIETDEFIFEES